MTVPDENGLLTWLADCVRNYGLVIRPPDTDVGEYGRALWKKATWRRALDPRNLEHEDDPSRSWLKQLGLHEDRLKYEPRAVAVSPCGRSVAVGTKAGEVQVWTWQGDRGWCGDIFDQPSIRYEDLQATRYEQHALVHAVRALGFIDPNTLVVAGGSHGASEEVAITVHKRVESRWMKVTTTNTAHTTTPPQGLHEARRAREGDEIADNFPDNEQCAQWQWIPLWMPGVELPSALAIAALRDERPRPLGLILTATNLLYVIDAAGDHAPGDELRFSATLMRCETLPHCHNLNADTRIVGGVFWRYALWLLDSQGTLYASAPPVPPRNPQLTTDPGPLPTPIDVWNCNPLAGLVPLPARVAAPLDGAPFSALRASWDALALRAGDNFTLLPTRPRDVRHEWYAHQPDTSAPLWKQVPNATGFEVFRAFADASEAESANDPLWLVVGSQSIGITWIAWSESATPPSLDHRALTTKFKSPLRTVVETLRSESLLIAHGFPRHATYDQPRGTTPCFLVLANRDHRLGIYSLIHHTASRKLLAEELHHPARVSTLLSTIEAPSSTLQSSRGLRRWYVAATMHADMLANPAKRSGPRLTLTSTSEESDIVPLPRFVVDLDAEDVLFLGRELRRCLKRAHDSLPDNEHTGGGRVIVAVQTWALRLLRRSVELPPEIRQELAGTLLTAFDEHARGPLVDLGLLAKQLRKWVVFGHTYQSKPEGLFDLVVWNAHARRDLDTLTYILRLLDARVDQQWSTSVAPDPNIPNRAVWSMATDQETGFTICSHHDGRLTAVDSDGSRIVFEPCSDIDHLYNVEDGGRSLIPIETDKFRQKHRHGRYASALSLLRVDPARQRDEESQLYILTLVMTGWQDTTLEDGDQKLDKRHPLLVLMVVERFSGSRAQLDCEPRLDSLRLMHMHWDKCLSEAQALHVSPLVFPEGKLPGIDIFVGLTDTHGGGTLQRWNFALLPSAASVLRIAPRLDTTVIPPAGVTGSVSALYRDDMWLFVGHDDGRIIRVELGSSKAVDPKLDVVELDARIACITGRPDKFGGHLIVYGTASGIVAALVWREKTPGSVAEDHAGDRHAKAAKDGLPRSLFASAHLKPIIALQFFDEPAPRVLGSPRSRLLAVDEDGRTSVYDVAYRERHDPVSSTDPESRGAIWHPRFAGVRLDLFSLPGKPRAVQFLHPRKEWRYRAVLGADGTALTEPPRIVVGDATGQVRCFELGALRESAYRSVLKHFAKQLFGVNSAHASSTAPDPGDCSLSNLAGLKASVGSSRIWEWLCMQDCGHLEILRFTLWTVLHRAENDCLAKLSDPASLPDAVEKYRKVLKDLGDEIYRRQPVTRAPVKVLWTKASTLSNLMMSRSLLPAGESGKYEIPHEAIVRAYYLLNYDLEVLTNRWAGFGSEFEERTLIHAFQCIFDWSDVILLSMCPPEDHPLKMVQVHLVQQVTRDRLRHADPLVRLEAVRTINLACFRALHWMQSQRPPGGVPRVMPRSGFGELVALVLKLAVNTRQRLLQTDPLAVELARFLALTLLLFPDSSLFVGRLVSEARLVLTAEDHERGLAATVPRQARMILYQLEDEFGHEWDRDGKDIEDFRRYLRSDLDAKECLLRISAQWPPGDPQHESNLSIARELLTVQDLGAQMSSLREEVTPAMVTLSGTKHFRQTLACFSALFEIRGQILATLRSLDTEMSPIDPLADWTIFETRAFAAIEAAGLFEPQRSAYRATIVERWRQSFLRRTELSAQIVRFAGRVVHGDLGARIATIPENIAWNPLARLLQQRRPSSWRAMIFEHLEGRRRAAAVQDYAETYDRVLLLALLYAVRMASEHEHAISSATTASGHIRDQFLRVAPLFGFDGTANVESLKPFPGAEYLWDVILIALMAMAAECFLDGEKRTVSVDFRPAQSSEFPARLTFWGPSTDGTPIQFASRAAEFLRDFSRLCRVTLETRLSAFEGDGPAEQDEQKYSRGTFLCHFTWD